MRCKRCGVCCQETEMLLSSEDVRRLVKLGYPVNSFAICQDGYLFLRNIDGHCVFFDPERQICKIYSSRPSGCRIYPVIYDEDEGIKTDKICISRETVKEKELKNKGKQVIRLLEKIDAEAENRKQHKP